MKTSNKIIAIGAGVAAMSVLGVYAFAQQGPGHGGMGMGHGMMNGMGPGVMQQGQGPMSGHAGDPAERLAALKTDIAIKPEQTAARDAYSKVVTETAAAMQAHRAHASHDAIQKMEPKDREAFAASMQKQRQQAQSTIKAAADALLVQLDDTQREKARQSLPGLVAAGTGAGMRFGMMGGPGMGHGMMGHGMGPHETK